MTKERSVAGQFSIMEGTGGREDDIASITRAAFAGRYGSGDGEVALIAALRADGDVAVELTALDAGDVVGHAMFSRLAVAPDTLRIAALAPVCARIGRQRSGIGSALIRKGLAVCRAQGFDAVLVLGDDYYGRFGFSAEAARAVASEFSGPHFQALALKEGA
ncbi:MAG TPA: N-acetyltransferase, partial [Rhizomicrobium sp.]|nr:N-acetyltransferase [Rhizomicrobium sp.]